jgi:hypothetical protein
MTGLALNTALVGRERRCFPAMPPVFLSEARAGARKSAAEPAIPHLAAAVKTTVIRCALKPPPQVPPTRTVQSVVRFDARPDSDGLVALREPGRLNRWAASAFRAGFTRTQVAAAPAQRSRGRVAAKEGSVRLAGSGPCSVGGGASATTGSSDWPQRAASSARAWPREGPRPPSQASASAPRGPSWATSRPRRGRRARRGMLRRVWCFG